MTKMRNILRKWPAALALFICALLFLSPSVYADPDGTELQITDQPEKLVIQLGPEWAGVEFQLMTDVGLYPQPVIVSPEGILTMELGGSKTYTLSAMGSAVPIPSPDATSAVTNTDSAPQQPIVDESPGQPATTDPKVTTQSDNQGDGNLIKGIPNLHLFLFAGGLIAGVVGLVTMRIRNKRKNNRGDCDDDFYDE